MPTYEYQCRACGHKFEKFQRITEDPVKDCPACGKSEVKRLVSAAAFHLKGSGWYKTDYASGSSTPPKSETKSEGKTETKSEAKSESTKSESKPSTASEGS